MLKMLSASSAERDRSPKVKPQSPIACLLDLLNQLLGDSVQIRLFEPLVTFSPSPPLCRHCVATPLEIDAGFLTAPWPGTPESPQVGPDPCGLFVLCSVLAVINVPKRNPGHERSVFEHARLGIFDAPNDWFEVVNDLESLFNPGVGGLQISWRFCRRAKIFATRPIRPPLRQDVDDHSPGRAVANCHDH